MDDKIKFPANVILIDVAFLNEVVYGVKTFLEGELGRKLPDVDLPAWLSYLALDAGLREQENEVEVLLVHTPEADVLKCCEPCDVNKLNHQACRTPLGEFVFSSVTSSGLVSTEELFLDLMNLALDSAEVKCLMPVPFHQAYGDRVEEKLADFFKDKKEEERGKAVYFAMKEPQEPVHCCWEPVFFSLAHVFGIKSGEL